MLLEKSGVFPQFKKGKKVKKLSTKDMQAELAIAPKYAQGGKAETSPEQALAKVFNTVFS